MQCTLCMVQCESREKSTTSDQICLISFFSMQSGRELAFEEGGTFVVSEQGCVGRCQLCMWAPTVAFSLKRRRQPLQGQRLSQRRCWDCLWGVPRFLCGKCHLIWRRKNVTFMIFCCCCVSMVFCCGDGPRGSRGWHKLEISVWFG